MALKEACEKEIAQSRETFVQFGDRSHCLLLPQQMVIFMSTSQTQASDVSPFGVMSRPQGCSQQCFHLWHCTVQNTDVGGNVLLPHSISGTEGGCKPDSDSGACLGNSMFTTRTWHWWYPGCPLCSTVPDTQPGLHPRAQKRGWRRLTNSAVFPFVWLCPSCQVLVPWELTSLLTAFVGWFGCGHPVLKAVPLCATCNPWQCSLGTCGRWKMRLSLQGCSSALPTGELCQSPEGPAAASVLGTEFQPAGHAIAWHFRRSSEVCSLPAAPSVGGVVLHAQAVCKQSITVCWCAGMCLLLPQQQQAGLLVAPALNLADSG